MRKLVPTLIAVLTLTLVLPALASADQRRRRADHAGPAVRSERSVNHDQRRRPAQARHQAHRQSEGRRQAQGRDYAFNGHRQGHERSYSANGHRQGHERRYSANGHRPGHDRRFDGSGRPQGRDRVYGHGGRRQGESGRQGVQADTGEGFGNDGPGQRPYNQGGRDETAGTGLAEDYQPGPDASYGQGRSQGGGWTGDRSPGAGSEDEAVDYGMAGPEAEPEAMDN
jgi:hypothetical protein